MNIYTRIQDTDLCKYLDDESTALLLKEAESSFVPARETVFSLGSPQSSIIILQQGELEMLNAREKIIGFIYPGEIAGETCFPDNTPAIYTLRARRDSTILKLSFDTLHKLIASSPEHGAKLHAAINDTICLKIIRITHEGESNEPA